MTSATELHSAKAPPTQYAPRLQDVSLKTWKRFDYLTHRWIGLILGAMVFVWFGSGFVMAYYRWPSLTESQRDRILTPFSFDKKLIGFSAARDAAERAAGAGTGQFVSGRLFAWQGRPTYALRVADADGATHSILVDGVTAAVLSPVSADAAAESAREYTGTGAPATEVRLLERGDLYMMNTDYAADFPAYRVRFGDPAKTAVYVNEESGVPVGIVTTATRFTTWFGTVPHWLYIMPLYHSRPTWRFVNIVLPSVAAILALTGIILGLSQLFPYRARGRGRVSPYHGVSRWHHLAGIVFGVLVLIWATSGAFQMIGVSMAPSPQLEARARGNPADWHKLRIKEAEAVRRATSDSRGVPLPLRIDLKELANRLGYDVRLQDGAEFWVDGIDGSVRGELTAAEARAFGTRMLDAPVAAVDRLASYDRYYYARPGREQHLPVWRVSFGDARHSVVYVNTFTGEPTGFVDPVVRRWRWLRDGLHTFDYPALNNKRPLWDFVVLPLLAGGFLSACTGVLLAFRRAKRMASIYGTS